MVSNSHEELVEDTDSQCSRVSFTFIKITVFLKASHSNLVPTVTWEGDKYMPLDLKSDLVVIC
jgi:hypothetical protein